ncbi:related to endosomal protein EMP70 [Cephalotrichum gorgonifer]|uniref:Transmembrane 9 superfamily member n=1 Tax=Cephalotrichum gorgonifer TaxID=2041049 RepID=A0AAE8MV29_9PEZI|nr:related to endosomal protein EMP70 [Cephalotrichum gorgonifer]
MRLPEFSAPAVAACLLALPKLSSAFYLPGVAPTSYKQGDAVPLYVNSIKPGPASDTTQLQSVISYDYYNPIFQFCTPEDGPQPVSESLGSILFGDRIMTSPFHLKMGKNETCLPLCTQAYDAIRLKFIKRRIEQGYKINWLVDGLPAGEQKEDPTDGSTFYTPGFSLGSLAEDGSASFHNHYNIFVEYHEVQHDKNNDDGQTWSRVVGVIVQPESKAYPAGNSDEDCDSVDDELVIGEGMGGAEVKFTYSVFWIESNTAWATRWDKYLHVYDPKIHWFWLVDTAIVVVILVMTVMSILVRTLKKDIARYNRLDEINLEDLNGTSVVEDGGVQEDSGWKLVHGDVFRNPSQPLLLSILLGNGAQLFVMTGFTIVFALLGFLSPSNRGSLGTIMILLYTVLGFVGGYVSARVYKSMQGDKWKQNIALTPTLVPGVVFFSFFLLDLFLWAKQSSGAVPFTTMLVIISIWFIISIPLSFIGSWLGFRSPAIEAPVRTNQIPRQIPPGPGYAKTIPSMLLVGLLPFGAIFVELYFILSSIWFSRIYYMFGFLFLCYALMIITCAAVTILMVYFLLCMENYHWQWRTFLGAGMTGGYIFLNCLIYLVTKLKLSSLVGIVLYIGYSALISFLFFILTGTIGYFASWWFVRRIYGSIKID